MYYVMNVKHTQTFKSSPIFVFFYTRYPIYKIKFNKKLNTRWLKIYYSKILENFDFTIRQTITRLLRLLKDGKFKRRLKYARNKICCGVHNGQC